MALTTLQRNTLFESLSPVIGSEKAALLLDQFPAKDGDELVTKDHLAAAVAGLHADLARLELRMYVVMVSLFTVATGIILTVGR